MERFSDGHLREELEQLKQARYEQIIDERTKALVQKEAEELDAASIETAICNDAKVLRGRIIEAQARRLKFGQITKLGKWIMSRHAIHDIYFGSAKNDWELRPTVATAPMLSMEEEAPEGKITYGWVFQLEGFVDEHKMLWWDGDAPMHVAAKYEVSDIEIFRAARDQATGLQTKELWFTVNPDSKNISCWKLAEQRPHVPIELTGELAVLEEKSMIEMDPWEMNDVSKAFSARMDEQNRVRQAPDFETGLYLLGLIRGATEELSR